MTTLTEAPAPPRRVRVGTIYRERMDPVSPHRLLHQPDTAAAMLGAATTGALSAALSIVTEGHVVAFGLLVMVMVLDMATGDRRARRSSTEYYDPNADVPGYVRKLRRLALVILAALFDAAALTLGNLVELPLLVSLGASGMTIASAIGWLIYREGLSVLDNIRRTEGKDVIPPALVQAAEGIGKTGRRRK